MKFKDRADAGQRLAAALAHLGNRNDLLILALPRGGVPVAAEVALNLGAPLDLSFAHKISAPQNPEFAIGSVAETGPPILEEQVIHSMHIPFSYVRKEAAFQQQQLTQRALFYRGNRPAAEIVGKCVILVDDGVATGATARAALQSLRNRIPAHLVFAAPVAAPDAIQRLAAAADELAILHVPKTFYAVGEFYEQFPQVSDEEVIALLTYSQQA